MATGLPSTTPILQFEDNITGLPLTGGKLYTWVSGASTTPQATYSNAALTNANPNPIILDNYGQAVVYLGNGLNYRFDLVNAAGIEQAHFPIDGINSYNLLAGVAAATSNTVTNKIPVVINGTTYYLLASTSAT